MTAEIAVTTEPDGVAVVAPRGRLNMVAAPRLTSVVAEVVASGSSRIVVDLTGTEFVDSSGLGALVNCLKKARQAGGDLRLACPGPQVRTVLELTNLHRVMAPADTVASARAAF